MIHSGECLSSPAEVRVLGMEVDEGPTPRSRPSWSTPFTIAGRNAMYEPTQEIIGAELRLRGTAQIADIEHILGAGFASLIPYEIQRMKETGLIIYDEPLGPDSILRFRP